MNKKSKNRTKHSKNAGIESEFKIILLFFLEFLLIPFRIIQVVFGKKHFSVIFSPFIVLWSGFIQAKFTFWFILINFFVFFLSYFFSYDFFSKLILFPSDLFNPERWFSFITHGFLHANITHLISNLIALFIFGRIVEKEIGSSKTAVVYFSALIFAGVFSSFISFLKGDVLGGIGASGAIMGLVSSAILLKPFKITFATLIPLPIMVLGWLMIYADLSGLFSGVNTGIGYAAHIGGFLSASLLFFLLRSERKRFLNGFFVNIFTLLLFLSIYFLFLS